MTNKRKFRGGFALCSECDRNARETRITTYCVSCIEDTPFVCDECREKSSDHQTNPTT